MCRCEGQSRRPDLGASSRVGLLRLAKFGLCKECEVCFDLPIPVSSFPYVCSELSRHALAGGMTQVKTMIEPPVALSSVPPDFLTLDEAAAVLRVGRSTAYREANAFEASGGKTGIPVIRFGKQFRVPRCLLEEQLGGPITWPPLSPTAAVSNATTRPARPRKRAARTAASRSTAQLALAIES